jgi:hypothetical protein
MEAAVASQDIAPSPSAAPTQGTAAAQAAEGSCSTATPKKNIGSTRNALNDLNDFLGPPAPFDPAPPKRPSIDPQATKGSKMVKIKFSSGKSPKERKAIVQKLLLNLLENEDEDDDDEDEEDWEDDGGGGDAQR